MTSHKKSIASGMQVDDSQILGHIEKQNEMTAECVKYAFGKPELRPALEKVCHLLAEASRAAMPIQEHMYEAEHPPSHPGPESTGNPEAEYERKSRMALEGSFSIRKNHLLKMAEAFENPDNEALIAVECDEELLSSVAFSFAKAAEALREVAEITAAFESAPEAMTEQKLEEMAAVAEAFAESDDPLLQKQAAVLDDILFSLASPQNALLFSNAAEDHDDRIEQLKKKYTETREKQQKWNHIAEAVKDIEKSPVYKEYRPNEAPLSTRYCPDHSGISTHRVGEHTVRCPLDGKTYNWDEGYSTLKGNKVPGTTVQEQNATDQHNTFTTFDSRSTRMGFSQGE